MATDRVTAEYGSLIFSEAVMQQRLPKPTYKKLRRVMDDGEPLDIDIANEVAHAMKEWALEMGATHFTHWFQPLTGITSEKHDSFITPKGDGGVLMTFSGKELVQGEPDASSFPSGGIRSTFEARGYTVWDPTSPAFIKDEVLCIPTAFISYTGEALDKKTPFLRSQVALEKQAKRLLALFGRHPNRVLTSIGAEQEYFLIREEDFQERPDLVLCGRTLFGCEPSKGQELDEHYFGAIRPTVNEFMKELDDELWKLGIPAKTKHNEVAPCQHELAPIYEQGSAAVDNNLLTMEKMKLLASHHGLACLLAEKPFAYVNGSGKHNNWSISSDGYNLLEPGSDPEHNLQFLVILACLVAAVDEHADLIRASVASAGNDHRLGANEAPPAIVSVFLGDNLSPVVEALINGTHSEAHGSELMDLGVPTLPDVIRDNTDRNRTSPFAFTGNKFEFRSLGSALNISCPNIMLNTMVADVLSSFSDELEKAADFDAAVRRLIRKNLKKHRRIIFNGDGYTDEWVAEAENRGLLNLKSTPDALKRYTAKKNIELFRRNHIFSEKEVKARQEILLENYIKIIDLEALTMLDMAKKDIFPAVSAFTGELAETIARKRAVSENIRVDSEIKLLQKLSDLLSRFSDTIDELDSKVGGAAGYRKSIQRHAEYNATEVLSTMERLREISDEMEMCTAAEYWPYPSYGELLFSVQS